MVTSRGGERSVTEKGRQHGRQGWVTSRGGRDESLAGEVDNNTQVTGSSQPKSVFSP